MRHLNCPSVMRCEVQDLADLDGLDHTQRRPTAYRTKPALLRTFNLVIN